MRRWFIPLVLICLVPQELPAQPLSTTLPALHAHGRELVDVNGRPVHLHGVNIGGWLVTEAWMCGQTDNGERHALEQLESRFGVEKAAALMAAWQDNWFTDADLDAIQSQGFNLIRVPFGWRTFYDATGRLRREKSGNIDFTRMDWLVREADRRKIYVIFDLHTWPGQYEEISRSTPAGNKARRDAAALWTQIARHYRDAGTIAAFDLINEPEGSPGNLLQKALYAAVREQDPRRMVAVESVVYSSVAGERWTNMIWSSHYPENTLKEGSASERLKAFDQKEKLSTTPQITVPIFIGETKSPQDNAASAADLKRAMDERGWNWAVWTYKGVDNGGWASFNYDRSLKYNLAADSYDELLKKWTVGLSQWRDPSKAKNYTLNDWWIEGFASPVTQPAGARVTGTSK